MFADYEDNGGNNKHNFYAWTTRKTILQDYDLAIRIKLPQPFSNFENPPLTFNYKTKTNNPAQNKIDLTIENGSGASIALTGNTNLVSTTNNTWASANINFAGSPTFAEGEWLTIHIKLSTLDVGSAYAGELIFNYKGL